MTTGKYKRVLAAMAFLTLCTAARAELRVSMAEALKAAVSKPQPEYSAIARQMKVAGKVEVEVTVGTDGSVENAKAVSGNPLLTASAISAVKKWKFTPFETNGQPTKAIATLNFNFQ